MLAQKQLLQLLFRCSDIRLSNVEGAVICASPSLVMC